MKIIYNEHLNLRPYLTAPHVKFHIQNNNDVDGVSMCGGIYPVDRYMVFSSQFVLSFNEINQCACCIKEFEQLAQSAASQSLAI
ncbi:MAG: hypothetical protein ABL869_07970 [Candidatus Nitrotoga sp.]